MTERQPKPKTWADRIDSAIGLVSPKTEFRRRAWRFKQKFALRYRGASKDRFRGGWIPGSGSADEDLLPDLPTLRDRCRELVRDDPYAAGIIQTMVVNVIGTGIRSQSRVDQTALGWDDERAEEYQGLAEKAWNEWTPWADALGRLDWYELQAQVVRQWCENGEALVLRRMIADRERPFRLAWQVIEADRLETPMNQMSNRLIRSGVELNDEGMPVAYHIRKGHPGDMAVQPLSKDAREYVRIPAWDRFGNPQVIHLFDQLRPGQTRGLPLLSPMLAAFDDLSSYIEAELVSARVAACFSLFIEEEDGGAAALAQRTSTNAAGQNIEELEPGMILRGGGKPTQINPLRPGSTFDPFVDRIQRLISMGANMPLEVVSKDYSKPNFSATKAALLDAQRQWLVKQVKVARTLCQPAWESVNEGAFLKGRLGIDDYYDHRADYARCRHAPPGWRWVDFWKDIKAAEAALEAGLGTEADFMAQQGLDWQETQDQRAREIARRQRVMKDITPSEKEAADAQPAK